MTWLESIFGVSPDAGSGQAELTLLFGLAFVALIAMGARRVTGARRRRQPG